MAGIIEMGDETRFAGFDLLATGHITMSGQKTITIGRYTAGQQTSLIGTLSTLNAGALWFNVDTGKLMYWSGSQAYELSETTSAGGDITAVNTNTGSGLTGGNTSGPITLAIQVDGTTIEIATNSLKVKDGGIGTTQLADTSVTEVKLANSAVTTAKLADDAVTSGKILDATIIDADINASAAIAWSKISKAGALPSDIGAVATTRAINTAAGSALSGGGDLSADRSLSVNVDNTGIEINSNALRLKDAGVTTAKLADTSVTEVKLANNAVTSAKIADGTITSADVDVISYGKLGNAPGEYLNYMPAGTECATGQVLKWDATNDRWLCDNDTGATDHGLLTGLGDDDHTQYVMLVGRTGGQNIRGGTAASNSLTLESTSHATKGYVLLQPTGGNVVIGSTAPSEKLDVNGKVRSTNTRSFASATGSITTSSASFVDVPGMTVTITSGAMPVMITAMLPCYHNTVSGVGSYRILIDGVAKADLTLQFTGTNDIKVASLQWMETLTAGSHTIKLQWSTTSGILTGSWGSATRSLMVWE